MKNIFFPHRTKKNEQKLEAIIVEFEDQNIGLERRQHHMDIHKIMKEKVVVPIMRETSFIGSTRKKSVIQFPLCLAYASTSHKLQGTIHILYHFYRKKKNFQNCEYLNHNV